MLTVPLALVPPYPTSLALEPLPSIRLAEPFEALRDASDRMLAQSARPNIFATLGKRRTSRRARPLPRISSKPAASVVSNDGLNRDEMVAAFKASGANSPACAHRAVYASEVRPLQALAAAGARPILAGRPGEQEQLRAAGLQIFIFAGCDVLAALRATYDLIAS